MIILNDSFIACEEFSLITSIEDIKNTKANTTLLFSYNEDLLKYCKQNSLSSAVYVSCVKEAIYLNALDVKYIISEKPLSIKIQKIADNYMFDAKNISIIESNEEFEELANLEIDGVIYNNKNIEKIKKIK